MLWRLYSAYTHSNIYKRYSTADTGTAYFVWKKVHQTYSFVDQVLMLFLLRENFLDSLSVHEVAPFALQFVSYVFPVS